MVDENRYISLIFVAEISLPNEQARLEILKIHAGPIAKHGEIGKSGLPLDLKKNAHFLIFIVADIYFSIKNSVRNIYVSEQNVNFVGLQIMQIV